MNQESRNITLYTQLPSKPQISGCNGWLTKLGKIRKNWKKRWFVLDDISRELKYFAAENSPKPQGSIAVKALNRSSSSTGPDSPYSVIHPSSYPGIQLETLKRTFFFYADTVDDQQKWLLALNQAIMKLKKPLGTPKKVVDLAMVNSILSKEGREAMKVSGEYSQLHEFEKELKDQATFHPWYRYLCFVLLNQCMKSLKSTCLYPIFPNLSLVAIMMFIREFYFKINRSQDAVTVSHIILRLSQVGTEMDVFKMSSQVREETLHWYRENSPPSISPVEYQLDAKINSTDPEPNAIFSFIGRKFAIAIDEEFTRPSIDVKPKVTLIDLKGLQYGCTSDALGKLLSAQTLEIVFSAPTSLAVSADAVAENLIDTVVESNIVHVFKLLSDQTRQVSMSASKAIISLLYNKRIPRYLDLIEYGNGIPALFLFLKVHNKDRELVEQAITIFINLMDSDRVRNSQVATLQEFKEMMCQLVLSDSLLVTNGVSYILYRLYSIKNKSDIEKLVESTSLPSLDKCKIKCVLEDVEKDVHNVTLEEFKPLTRDQQQIVDMSNDLLTMSSGYFKQKEMKMSNECGDKAIFSLGALIEKLPHHQRIRSLFVTASDLVTSIKLAYADDTSAASIQFSILESTTVLLEKSQKISPHSKLISLNLGLCYHIMAKMLQTGSLQIELFQNSYVRYADACKHIDEYPFDLIVNDSEASARARDEIPFRALFKWADALQDHFLAIDHALHFEVGAPLVEQSIEKFTRYLLYFPNSHPGLVGLAVGHQLKAKVKYGIEKDEMYSKAVSLYKEVFKKGASSSSLVALVNCGIVLIDQATHRKSGLEMQKEAILPLITMAIDLFNQALVFADVPRQRVMKALNEAIEFGKLVQKQ